MMRRVLLCILISLLASFRVALNLSLLRNTFKAGSLNVNRAREIRKRATICETAKLNHIDVLFLQETHSDSNNETDRNREWEGLLCSIQTFKRECKTCLAVVCIMMLCDACDGTMFLTCSRSQWSDGSSSSCISQQKALVPSDTNCASLLHSG